MAETLNVTLLPKTAKALLGCVAMVVGALTVNRTFVEKTCPYAFRSLQYIRFPLFVVLGVNSGVFVVLVMAVSVAASNHWNAAPLGPAAIPIVVGIPEMHTVSCGCLNMPGETSSFIDATKRVPEVPFGYRSRA